MKYKTVLEYLVDEIKSELDDIKSIANRSEISTNNSKWIKTIIGTIEDKLNIICE